MPDLIKELKESLVEGIQRLQVRDRAGLGITLPLTGRAVGTGIAFGGASGTRDDNRVTTGYDAAKGVTTVAIVLDASLIDGDDLFSM